MNLLRPLHVTRALSLSLALLFAATPVNQAMACMAATVVRGVVANADQTVILIWDPTTKTQHFIRKASFKTTEKDVGFVVPSPGRPELAESGNQAFPFLANLTAPVKYVPTGGCSIGCSAAVSPVKQQVTVIETKLVAGFNATVLTATSGEALNNWLADNDYANSPALAEWAAPYIGQNWFFTALKVAKPADEAVSKPINASSLRISFQTEKPLFPYREPDSSEAVAKLGLKQRLLRIYFISNNFYKAEFSSGKTWSGQVKWAGGISYAVPTLFKLLDLPQPPADALWCLTEFEDNWPYAKAEGDVYFVPNPEQKSVTRPWDNSLPAQPGMGIHTPASFGTELLVGGLALWSLRRSWRRRNKPESSD